MGAEPDSRVRNYISGRRDKEDCANGSRAGRSLRVSRTLKVPFA